MDALLENKIETVDLINKVTDKLSEFVMTDEDICDDYAEYLRTMGGDSVATTIPYIFERILNSKSITELYLEKHKKLDKEEKNILKGFMNSVSSVFEIKRIAKNRFELFNIINEKMYSILSPIKMTAFRGLGVGYYIVARFFTYEKENYLIEMIGVYSSTKKDMAYKYAISKIIQTPSIVYQDNNDMKKKIEKKVKYTYNRFNELFGTDEITTSNKFADDLIEYLNGSVENIDFKSKIEDVDVKKYFDVSSISTSNMFSNGGFSSYSKPFDVTLIVDNQWGFYAIPFYKTFCNLLEGKEIENADKLVEYFLTTNAISKNILERLAAKYTNFMEVINKIMGTEKTFDELICEYKPTQTYASTTILEESSVFSKVVDDLAEEENTVEIKKVGRNDPCPCGSGKKYKKCCMLKVK